MQDDDNNLPKKRGRPKGQGAETRAKILVVARAVFSENGFERTTIRGIGERAGIDPSLVMQYFGSKEQLFIETIEKPSLLLSLEYVFQNIETERWGTHIAEILSEPSEQQGFFHESEAVIRAAASRPEAAASLRELYQRYLLSGLVASKTTHPEMRATMLAMVIIGFLYTNGIAELPGFITAPTELRLPLLAHIIQSILTCPLDHA